MAVVQPIRDEETIERIMHEIRSYHYSYYMVFLLGINIGLRIGDILKLKVQDVRGRSHIKLNEKKTKKPRLIQINEDLKVVLDDYIKYMPDGYLFPSRRTAAERMSRENVYRIIVEAAKTCGVEDLGTHTMRKTFGYHFYKRTKNIALLMLILNHRDQHTTLGYIGITQDLIDDAMMEHSLGLRNQPKRLLTEMY